MQAWREQRQELPEVHIRCRPQDQAEDLAAFEAAGVHLSYAKASQDGSEPSRTLSLKLEIDTEDKEETKKTDEYH